MSANSNIAIKASALTKRFNDLFAVNQISFEINFGETYGFLGPNGAGKTTTIRLLYGMLPPTSGSLTVLGFDIATDARRARHKIGVMPQEINLDVELNVSENLEIYANYFGIPRKEAQKRLNDLLKFTQLDEKATAPIDSLSGGMKKRLLLGRALLNKPQLLILDEPTSGLDPKARLIIWEKLRELRSSGTTIVLTTHYMEEAERLCDRVAIMDQGKIVAEGKPAQLIKEHTASQILELQTANTDWQNIIKIGGSDIKSWEIYGKTIFLFSEQAERVLQLLQRQQIQLTFYHIRPANLEDVFLKLTGKKLKNELS
jgi:lipooligosaccharide transport system ATP-binding protein